VIFFTAGSLSATAFVAVTVLLVPDINAMVTGDATPQSDAITRPAVIFYVAIVIGAVGA
jgi:hypothetical protein